MERIMGSRLSTIEELKAMGWGDKAEAFHAFMQACDKACNDAVGVSIMDLPDQDFASAFEDELDPEEFVADVIIEEIGDLL
jgi:hypothetical protein